MMFIFCRPIPYIADDKTQQSFSNFSYIVRLSQMKRHLSIPYIADDKSKMRHDDQNVRKAI